MKSNASKIIKHIFKSWDGFENESEMNYVAKKPKQKFSTKKPDYRKYFLEEKRSKVDLNPDYDTDNSEDGNFT